MLVRGENCLVLEYVELLEEWVLYGCARSVTFTLETSMIETSITGSGGWKTTEPAQHSFTGTLEGLVNLEEPNLISLADLRQKQIDRQKLKLRFQRTALDGIKVYSEEAFFYITSSSDNGSLNQVNNFTVELQGTGAITQVYTPSSILASVKRFQLSSLAVDTYVLDGFSDVSGSPVSLIGKTVLGLWASGEGLSKQITAGTPVAMEFKHDAVTGKIYIGSSAPSGTEFFGFYY